MGADHIVGFGIAEQLRVYENAWKSLLANELTLGLSFRTFYGWIGDQ